MIYKLQQGIIPEPILSSMDHIVGKFILIVIFGMIGLVLGLWVAEMTLPLPNQMTVYVTAR